MRRWLAALLLAMLSVQLSWAAVAPYCQHEAAQSGHFGHHEHQHRVASVHDAEDMSSTDQSTGSAFSVDLDCGQCHGTCVGLTQVASPTLESIPAELPNAMAAKGVTAGSLERPERPKWSYLA